MITSHAETANEGGAATPLAGLSSYHSENGQEGPPGKQDGASLRRAIDRKCRECTYDPCSPGRWREQVEACTITGCSLWPVRPHSKPRGGKHATPC